MPKEPEIKLFGRKIVFPENGADLAGGEYSGVSSVESGGSVDCDRCLEVSGEKQGRREGEGNWEREDEGEASGELSETTAQEGDENPSAGAVEESQNTNALSELDNSPKSLSTEDDNDAVSANQAETETEQSDATEPHKKTLKKPDKILPCPRCKSTDTKFCYYNNYNVNQPRHFCRSCQRYWTAGGTMRNVPVGAGRRKNKNLASHCRHIMISEALPAAAAAPIDTTDAFRHLNYRPNGTVLSFGTVPTQCEAMYIAGKGAPNGASNGYCKTDEQGSTSSNGKDCSTGYSEGGKNMLPHPLMQNVNAFVSPVPCIPGVPWPLPWNSAVPIPTGYILPYYPTPYWSCPMPNAWNVPLLSVPSTNGNGKETTASNPNSQLGKHSRSGELLKPNDSTDEESAGPKNADNPLVVPKTLRIDDPEEAAKSSIWTTLGIKCGSFRREDLFKALQPKADKKKALVTTSPLLQANPAALSRSITFQESI